MKFQAIKGTRDILPPDSAQWERVEQTARRVFAAYGFQEIRTPIFEQTELFARSIGAETDVVSKEMYTFVDRPAELPNPLSLNDLSGFLSGARRALAEGEIPGTARNHAILQRLETKFAELQEWGDPLKSRVFQEGFDQKYSELLFQCAYLAGQVELGDLISLRPEATASVCRAYIEHGMHTLPGNVKLCYIGPMFRRERPQKGRHRQFYQIGAEVLGPSDAPGIDAEVIEMLLAFFARLSLEGAKLSINSIGCRECRPKYVELLRAELQKVRGQLGPDSQRRTETNPLRVLDSKLPEEQAIIEKLPRIADHLCPECREHFAKLQEELNLRGIGYEINWRLVRGLDYYTRTTFEITAPGLGSQNAVCGGGRYDGLVELLGGPAGVKGIGFAIGTDRLVLSLQETGKLKAEPHLDAFIAWMGAASYPAAVRLARLLRERGVSTELPAEEMKFKKAIGLADKLGARYALIIGEDEVKSGEFTLKRLADGTQEKLAEAALMDQLTAPRNQVK